MNSFKQIQAVSLAVLILLCSSTAPVRAADSLDARIQEFKPAAASEQLIGVFEKELETLLREFYPKAKITRTDKKIHFEFKCRPVLTPRNRKEIAPDFGGVMGDLELRPGPYTGKVRLPQQYHEHAFYSVILMAPYCQTHDLHVYTKLLYPSDAVPDFTLRFKEMMRGFEELSETVDSVGNAAQAASSDTGKTTASNQVPVSIAEPGNVPASTSSGPVQSAGQSSSNRDETSPLRSREDSISIASKIASVLPSVAQPAALQERQQKVFFWKATKGTETVYLLGTIHGAIAQFYPLPTAIDQAFDKSKHLMVEIAIDKVDGSKVRDMRDKLAYYTPPDHLSKHLTPSTKKVFEDYLKWSGESWAMYEKYRPWYAAEIAAQSKRWRGDAFRASLGLDLYFLTRAREAGKAISDLETVEQQLRIDAELSEPAQDMLLRTSILGFKDMDAETRALLSAWKEGDTDKMERITTREFRARPELREYEKKLLDDRNVAMVAKAKQLMRVKPGPHFLAVGAAHLVGPMGLVRLFEAEGFNVEQVSSAVASAVAALPGGVKKQSFPERFRIWLPDQPKRVADKDRVRYEFYERPCGAYIVCVLTAPTDPSEWGVPAPLLLDKLVSIFKPLPGTLRSLSLQGFPGREAECSGGVFEPKAKAAAQAKAAPKGKPPARDSGNVKGKPAPARPGRAPTPENSPVPGEADFGFGQALKKIDAADSRARVRAYLAGRRFYLVCAIGTEPFLASDNVKQFFDSLEIIPN